MPANWVAAFNQLFEIINNNNEEETYYPAGSAYHSKTYNFKIQERATRK